MNTTLGTDLADRWVCGAFQPGPQPYRCTEPYDHPHNHRAILDGTLLAEWPRDRNREPLPPIDLPVLHAVRGGVADHTHTNDGGWCAPTDFIGLPARSSTMTDTTTNHEPPFGTAEHAELVAGHRHPGIRDGLQRLTYTHLQPALHPFSEPFYRAAVRILWEVGTDSPELTTTINRLVEAKDSAVLAGIRHTTGRAGSVPRPQAVTDPPKMHTPEETP